MRCATVGDLKALLENADDASVVTFLVVDQDEPGYLVASGDIEDHRTLTADIRNSRQTSDGERNTLRLTLRLDCDI